ncbi:MAG: hypothetical protein JG718_02100 [Candidatus Thiothrix moscowensis]|nr:hypothetical protein [Candidatus Thiothrix moscowensis]
MNTQQILELAAQHMQALNGHCFDVLEITKPASPEAAVNLAKIISKLSPLVGNLIEFNTCEYLNQQSSFAGFGKWRRQDPGFPDTVFDGQVSPTPGLEIKAWFPLATEITARFKDSQNHFIHDQTHVAMLAWLPEFLLFGKPKIVGIAVISGASIAKARDEHYHRPPDYLVLEPEDTSARTSNLQQTNTNGYKFQGTAAQYAQAQQMVQHWGANAGAYLPTREYQALLRELLAQFPYRLDTNFAKMDRIAHSTVEAFKAQVLATEFQGRSIGEWGRLFAKGDETSLGAILTAQFGVQSGGDVIR